MSSDSSFSYSFALGNLPVRSAETPLFALDRLSEFPLPGDRVLARNPRNGREMVLPAEVMNALSYCKQFRSLDGHVEDLLQGGPADPGREAAIRSVIKSVLDGGLFLPAREVVEQLAPAQTPAESIGKPVVAIITWERPEALRRLLKSMHRNCDLSAIDACIVVDDSRNEDNCRTNRQIAAEAQRETGSAVEYFGAAEAGGFMASLIRELPQHEKEIRFLLDREAWQDHWTAGIARNYCQLLSVGKPLIVCDDDVICDVYETPDAERGVTFSESTREAFFYPDQDAWPSPAADGQRDPLARHMQVLGLTLPEALTALNMEKPGQDALSTASAGFAVRLKRESRVLTTECASLGDPGTGNNRWLATLPARSRDRLLQSPDLLQSALKTRNCWLGRLQPVFAPNSNISQITGADNRDFLPPYFPIMRGQDRIFGETNQFLFPDSVILDLPWAAPHLPVRERVWSGRDNDFSRPASFPGGLTSPPVTLHDRCHAAERERRIEFLAGYYFDLAQSSDHKLVKTWSDDWLHSWSVSLTRLNEQILATPDAPEAWRKYLELAYRQTRQSKLTETDITGLKSTDLNLAGRDLAGFWRQAWQNQGNALLAWSDIRKAARTVRRPG